MNIDEKVKALLKNYNKLRDDLILEYNIKIGDKRGDLEKNLTEVLAIDVWFIEESDKTDAEFIKALNEIYGDNKAEEWTPVKERLPEESYNSVIGWDDYRERCVFVQFYNGYFHFSESVNIVAWQPLPKPYKEETKVLKQETLGRYDPYTDTFIKDNGGRE